MRNHLIVIILKKFSLLSQVLIVWIAFHNTTAMARRTTKIDLPNAGKSNSSGIFTTSVMNHLESLCIQPIAIGSSAHLLMHSYGPAEGTGPRAYIQATLHADEIPGLLVNHHLIKLLDDAEKSGSILNPISVIPFANPIGLSQQLLGSHIGRFSLDTGVNFNRDWPDVASSVASKIEGKLTDDEISNVKLIREAICVAVDEDRNLKVEAVLKKKLYKIAATSDVVLDLHCDTDAVMHMYTHDRLWPQMSDLARELKSECHLLASNSGGNPFDEACSCIWASLADKFPGFPIPMACQSVTVELRGEVDVYDELASGDAQAIFRFLQRRGFIAGEPVEPAPALIREAGPLTGVDMIEASVPGVVAWRVRPGAIVKAGDVLGEIVNIEDPDAPRTPVLTRASGLVFGMRSHKLVRPGQIIIKVAGEQPLDWRTGNLLTSR